MSQDREPRYVDFMHHYEERLNLIYSHWEAQIEQQIATNKSQTLVSKIKSHKKTVLAGIAIVFGSAFLVCQYSQKINSRKTLIANNSQKLEQMTLELQRTTASPQHMACVRNGDIYQLTSGSLNHLSLPKEPRYFAAQDDTISVIRHSINTKKPDAYLRLNPDQNLLYGSTEQTNDTVQTVTRVIDLEPDLANLSSDQEAIDNYTQVQEQAIALHQELSQCFEHYGGLGTTPLFPQFPYAD